MTDVAAISDSHGALPGVVSARRLSQAGRKLMVWVIFSLIALSTLYPLVFLTMTAFRTNDDYLANPAGVPRALTLDNLTRAIGDGHMGRYAINSLLVVVPAVILLAVVSCLAAYALTHFDFRFRGVILVCIIGMLALPVGVLIIPIFKVVINLGLLNSRLGLILVYTAILLPFNVYLLSTYMRTIPRELHYAAQIDGAGAIRSLWSVVLPLVRPGLFTVITLDFLALWNDLLFSLLILQKESSRTIMVGIAQFQGHMSVDLGAVAAGLLVSMIPPLLIFLFFQRNLTRDVTGGAIK